ncbi:MAG TPA: MFS transporter [Kofleriaceae bacterium]|nr:MFS transporter [Kofleriaceae bacterium]
MHRDRRILYATAFLRALAVGYVGILSALHLAAAGLRDAQVGAVIGAGLGGAAVAALVVTVAGDRLGRRRSLVALSLLGGAGGAAFALVASPVALAAVAFAGMVNGMGRDRGAALVLEQAVLPATTDDAGRTRAFAAYNIAQDAGHAAGAMLAALPAWLRAAGLGQLEASRTALLLYAALTVVPVVLYARLSPAIELPAAPRKPLAPESRRRIAGLSALFALDSLGGGFLTAALLALFFRERFGASETQLGLLFFAARAANAASHAGAALLARRIGLLKTMVFTHLPSSLLLATVPLAPSFPIAALLFLLREGLVEMDVPTRQSFTMAVVRPDERTFASGITHLVRLGGWAVAPGLAGLLAGADDLGAPLMVGAALKILYDVLLFVAFRRVVPPEERAGGGAVS